MSRTRGSRRGDLFIFMLNIFFLLAIIIIFSKLHAAFTLQNRDEGVGTRQAALLHTYAMSEQMLLYVDEAAKFAAYESIATVMGHGGVNPVTPKCPERYATYPQWTRPDGPQCFPDASVDGTVYDAFRKEMQVNLRKYLNYPGMPVVSYDIMLGAGNGLTITGIAQDQLTLPIVAAKDARQQAITPYLTQDNVAKSVLDFTADTTLPVQLKPSVNRRQRTGDPTNITIHSTRTPDAATALQQYDRGTISVHYLLDVNGALYQILPEDQAAFLCEDCSRLEDRSIAIALVNPAPAVPADGACASGQLLRDEWCRDCAAACYESYTQAQLERLEELLTDILDHQRIPAQNINLAGQLLAADNPGPALKSGASQRQWLADLLVRVAGAKQITEEYEDLAAAGTASAISGQIGVALPLDDMTITSCYGHRNRNGGQLHYGVDFRAREPTPVRAIADGVIAKQCDNCPGTTGFGLNTLIHHPNGMASHYSHLSSFSFRQGDVVKKGDIIGLSGNTGSSDAPHLHFAVFTSHVENPISTLASNPLCIFPDEQLKSIKVAANNCQYELTHTDPALAQSCAGVQQMRSVPICGFNSVPLDAKGDAALTLTLDRIKKIDGLEQAIEQASRESLVDSRLLIAQLVQESAGRHDIVTFDGGVGIAQFTDLGVSRESFQGIGDVSMIKLCKCENNKNTCNVAETACDRADPRLNPAMSVRAQARLLSRDVNRYSEYTDKIQFALAAYNTGNPNVDKAIRRAQEGKGTKDPRWEDVSPYLHEITQKYVPSILRHYAAQGGTIATSFSDASCSQFNVKEMGTYAFAPSFSVTVPDLLTAVNRTADWAQEAYAACDGRGGMDTRVCLNTSTQEFNRDSADLEIISCEAENVRVLHSLQQVIADCSMNRQDGCACTWRPGNADAEVKIQLLDNRGTPAPVFYTAPNHETELQTGWVVQGQPLMRAVVLTIGEQNTVTISDPDGSDEQVIPMEQFRFVKQDGKMMLTLDRADACGVYKTTHQVCAQVKQKIPVLSKGTDFETPQIKFALYLNDTVAPEAVQQITAITAGGVAVTFTHSPSADVSYYKVSCAVTGEYGEEEFVNARGPDGYALVSEPLNVFFITCNNQPVAADTNFKIRVVPYDISGNAGEEAVYDSALGSLTGGLGVQS